jgi:para-aminobenzoate synthetase/4-amino-4-deoxychorismate lyase
MRFSPAEGVVWLDLHLDRLRRSAAELGFTFDRDAVLARIEALIAGLAQPAKLRLLLSRGGEIALESGPLPPPLSEPAPCIALPLPVVPGDWRLRHKTTDRHFYEAAVQAAREQGAVEAVFVRPDGLVTEGSFTNIFVERDGLLLTPRDESGLLPGIARRALIEEGRAFEANLTLDDLAGGFLIGNALRGLMQARLLP